MTRKLIFPILVLGLSFPAFAGTITFSDRTSFDAATSATTLIDFESTPQGLYGSTLVVGDVTFTDNAPRLFVFGPGSYGVPTAYLNNNSVGTEVNINFANPTTAVGMDLGFIYNWGGGLSADITLSSGYTQTLSFASNGGLYFGGSWSFWGMTSDVGITNIKFSDHTGGLAIDNLAYGSAAVPESASTVGLLIGGLLGIAGISSRRTRRQLS